MTSNLSFRAQWLRIGFVPAVAGNAVWAITLAAGAGRPELVVVPVVGALALSFIVERVVPYESVWNNADGDRGRDIVHVLVNEISIAAALAATTKFGLTQPGVWPAEAPFALQVVLALLLADLGITLMHFASHRVGVLWRFHAVHHSVRRFYGMNGLIKHPVHQSVEGLAGLAPLFVVGVPTRVAYALVALIAMQLLLQHSNVAVRVGRLGNWWALAPGHRQHHLADSRRGDVNFGLFLLAWDRLLGTYSAPAAADVRAGSLGIAGQPNYPATYIAQFAEPFRINRRER